MARPGVTYQDVVNAATEVKGQGKNPTIENVRAILGTGSIGTINMHLRKWKSSHQQTEQISSKENLPPELVSVLKGLWERVVQTSEDRIQQIEASHQKITLEMTQELEKYKKNNQRWQQMYNQWIQEKTQIINEKSTLLEGIQSLQKEITSLRSNHESLEKQQEEKQKRIDELNRLHHQLQENLEYYRTAAREQRLIDQENFERQKQELQSQLKTSQEKILIQQDKLSQIQQRYHVMEEKYTVLQTNHDKQTEQLKNSSLAFKQLEKEFLEANKMNQHWQSEYQQAQLKIETYTRKINENQIETQLSKQHLQSVQKEVEELRSHNKLITHDKWIISQEKAQLEGQLKQLKIMLDSERIS